MTAIRPEQPDDEAAVAALLRAAFGGEEEAALVARLRRDGDVLLALVAEEAGAVAGHVLFSRLQIERPAGGREILAAALAPLAVAPDRQRRGIGTALTEAGVKACRAARVDAVFVLGHPGYYPRFGFSAEAARSCAAPFEGEAFMALALTGGALADGGRVRYAPAFGLAPEWTAGPAAMVDDA